MPVSFEKSNSNKSTTNGKSKYVERVKTYRKIIILKLFIIGADVSEIHYPLKYIEISNPDK